MPDPWLTEDGELCPALVKAAMPEWKDGRDKFRLWHEVPPNSAWPTWRVQTWSRLTAQSKKEWLPYRDCTPYEAHALIEKDLREKLAERHLGVELDSGVWLVFDTEERLFLRPDGAWGDWEDAQQFDTYPAALQAAVLAEGE